MLGHFRPAIQLFKYLIALSTSLIRQNVNFTPQLLYFNFVLAAPFFSRYGMATATMTTTITRTTPARLSTITLKAEPSPLLDLPLDIMYEVMDFLPIHTKAILSQTSSDLRAVVKHDVTRKLESGPRSERITYLRLREKAMPHLRLCYMCMKLHKMEV